MVDNVRNFFSSGVYRRMASIATTSICILFCVPLAPVFLLALKSMRDGVLSINFFLVQSYDRRALAS